MATQAENVIIELQEEIFSQLSCSPHSCLPPLFLSPCLILCLSPSRHLHSCWRTSRTSCGPTLPCTLTRRSWSCRCLPLPVVAACAPCLCTSRRLSVLPESTSSDRAMHCRPSSLSVRDPWRCSKMAWCWPSWVRYREGEVDRARIPLCPHYSFTVWTPHSTLHNRSHCHSLW